MTLLEPLPATVAGLTPDEDDAFRLSLIHI